MRAAFTVRVASPVRWWPLFIAILATCGDCGEPSPSAEQSFVDWAGERAVRFETLDWRAIDPDRLGVLDEALEGKRFVYLGESDHFMDEKNDFRMILIRYLATKGFRSIGMEMGMSDARRMDRYVATGDESWLDRVALYGYDGDQREDRDDSVEGWTDHRHAEFEKQVTSGSRWCLRQIREMNERLPESEPPLRWFGYDVSMKPGGGYADVREMLASGDEEAPFVQVILKKLARVPGESRIAECERLLDLADFLDEEAVVARDALGASRTSELKRMIRCMAQGLSFVDALKKPIGSDERRKGLVRRENVMIRQLDEIVAAADENEKFILLGHAMHLSKDSTTISSPGFEMWPSVGSHVARKYPGEVYAIWMLADHGRHGNPRARDPVEAFPSLPGTVESLLARIAPALLLPLHSGDPRESYLAASRPVRFMTHRGNAVLSSEIDAIFFVSEVRECRMR